MEQARRWIRPWWVLIAFVTLALPGVFSPIEGTHHIWRQADTAAVARNFVLESFDPFHPRIDLRGDTSGITGMEFPLYQLLAAIPMKLFGTESDVWLKLVSLLCMVWLWLVLARLLVRVFLVDEWCAFLACAAVPIMGGYADKVMPETLALALAAFCADRIFAWLEQPGPRDLVLAAVSISLAGLVRPYVIVWGVFLVVALVKSWPRSRRDAAFVLLAGVAALVPFVWWYAIWCPHLVEEYGIDYYFRGSPLGENLGLLAHGAIYKQLIEVSNAFYLKKSLHLLALVGLGALPAVLRQMTSRAWGSAFLVVTLASVPVVLAVVGDHFQPHVYYLIGAAPGCMMLLAVGLDALRKHVPLAFVPVALFALAASAGTYASHFREKNPELAPFLAVKADVDARTQHEELFVVEDAGPRPWYLYALHRRGWALPRERLDDPTSAGDLAAKGCRWVVARDASGAWTLSAMDEWLRAHSGGP